MTRIELVLAFAIGLLAACTDRTGASVQSRAPTIVDGVDGCVELNQRGESTDARLVQLGLEGSKRDGRPTRFHKAVPSADGALFFYVFEHATYSDVYVVYETDSTKRQFTRAFGYGSLGYPCIAADRL